MIDFLVIGGGIAGISAAARLSHLGRVTVLEREPSLAYHASGRSAALFEQTYGAASVIALNEASHVFHETANGGVLSPRGLMMIATSDQAAMFAADVKAMNLEQISIIEAQKLIPVLAPDVVSLAAYADAAQDIDTDLLIQNFAREVRTQGGEVVTGAGVTGITRTQTGWRVTAMQDYEAHVIINAAGAWADEIAVMAGIAVIGLQPYRRSMARIAAPGARDISKWPMMFGVGETWYAKPDAGALIVSPADEDSVAPMDAWADDMVLAEGLERYQTHVTEPVMRPLATWAGLRTFAPDRTLVLGPSSQDKTFIWCAGQGGYGFSTAPAASQLVADLVGGQVSGLSADVIAALSPSRFAS